MILPVHDRLKKIFCLSEWHKTHFLEKFPQFTDKTQSFSYGIDMDELETKTKIPYKFIYSSFPNRGLVCLLEMWKKIIQKIPQASLFIYSDMNGKWANEVAKDDMNRCRELLSEYTLFPDIYHVHYVGWTDKKTLMDSWRTADVWFYPTTFTETFCLTALESARTRTLAITMDRGSLINTVNNRGILLEGDPRNNMWQDWAVNIVTDILSPKNREKKEALINENYKWSANLTWENRGKEMTDILLEQN